MIEYEPHSVSMSVDSADSSAEGGDEIVHRFEQNIGQHGSFEMAPKPFDQVKIRAVRWQPEDGEAIGVLIQERPHCLGVMKTGVVANQANLSPRVAPQQDDQEGDEVPAALGVGHRINDAARSVIHTSVNHLLLVLSRRGDFRLSADRRPHARQRGVPMNLDLVLEDQGLCRVSLQRVFFKRRSRFAALSWAASLRLPLRVCLGR